MSFRCQQCSKVAHKPKIVTTKSRMHLHKEMRPGEYGDLELQVVGEGPQIVEQKKLCGNCA